MINLLPPARKKDVLFSKRNVLLRQYMVIIWISIVGMIGLMYYGRISLLETRDSLQDAIQVSAAEVAELEPVNKEATELASTISTIGTLLDQEVKFSFVIQEIGSLIPPGVGLTSLSLDQDTTKPIRLSFDATEFDKAGVLQQNLEQSDLFLAADVLAVTRGSNESLPFSGEIQAYFNPELTLNQLDTIPARSNPQSDVQSTEPQDITTEEVETEQ